MIRFSSAPYRCSWLLFSLLTRCNHSTPPLSSYSALNPPAQFTEPFPKEMYFVSFVDSQVRASTCMVYYCSGCYLCHQAAHRASIHWAVKPNVDSDQKVSVSPSRSYQLFPAGHSLSGKCFSEQADSVLLSLNLGLGFKSKRLAYKGYKWRLIQQHPSDMDGRDTFLLFRHQN